MGAVHKPTSSDLAELEQRLRAMRGEVAEAIRARLAGPESAQGRRLASLLGEGDVAVEDMFTETEIALVEHELNTLHDIDDALRRIEFDIGGICTQCGAAIPLARLRAMPTAAMCIDCATARAG